MAVSEAPPLQSSATSNMPSTCTEASTSSSQPPEQPSENNAITASSAVGLATMSSSTPPASAGKSATALPTRPATTAAIAGETVSTVMEAGPGPTRHPKPLTAAELFAQLEKEQEAVVNRLTRELTLLRSAHNSSVVSNNSSTSASALAESADYNTHLLMSGLPHPSPSHLRRHRSSSAASNISAVALTVATADRARGPGIVRLDGSSGASLPGTGSGAPGRSRQESMSRANIPNQNLSGASSPITMSKYSGNYYPLHGGEPWSSIYQPHPSVPVPQRYGVSRSSTNLASSVEKETQLSSRFEEMALMSDEFESVKRENEFLRRRIRELEDLVKQTKKEPAPTEASPPDVTTGCAGQETEEHKSESPSTASAGTEANTPRPAP